MKKVSIDFVCDRCSKPLPKKFVKENDKHEKYFDLHKYNEVNSYVGRFKFDISLDIDPDFGPTHHELCPECRLYYLKTLVGNLEKEGEKENA